MESMSENQSGYNDESQFQSLADTVDLPPAAVGEISKGYQTKLRRLAVCAIKSLFNCVEVGVLLFAYSDPSLYRASPIAVSLLR